MLAEKIYRKCGDLSNPVLAPWRAKKLRSADFTIISNNCWGGSVYRHYGIRYNTPTAGLYLFAEDYVRFVSDLHHYLELEPEFIDPAESIHKESLEDSKQMHVPVARIDDIEIVYLHYRDKVEARDKWLRRVERVNWNDIFLKFSKMNCCTEDHLRAFDAIPVRNKICFTTQPMPEIESSVVYKARRNRDQIDFDTTYFCRYFNLTKWLNQSPCKYESVKSGAE